jgi:hypothetical protein
MWLFDEADARYQVDDGTVSSLSKYMIHAEDCNEEDDPAVALVVFEIDVSLVTAALDIEDGAWVLVDAITGLKVDATARLEAAAVALLSTLVISCVFIFIED